MASLTKAKTAYSTKIKRRPAIPPVATDRTGLKVQEIPPELCHLTGDALAIPFPPIALGGYMKYYKAHPGRCVPFKPGGIWDPEQARLDLEVVPRDGKKKRRVSASMLLGPLRTQIPKSSPSTETTPTIHLFHIRSSSSPEIITPSPASPITPSPTSRSRQRHFLSIIPEASRETMRAEMGESISQPTTPRKPRVISCPSGIIIPTSTKTSLTTPALTLLSLDISSTQAAESASSLTKSNSSTSNNSVPLSPGGSLSLRRKKRQILRTPDVENYFARSARELFSGFGSRRDFSAGYLSRENSSTGHWTEEDCSLSPTASVSTALTSVLDSSSSLPPSPSSQTKLNPGRRGVSLDLVNKPSTLSDGGSESDVHSSPTISTPPTSLSGGRLLDDAELRKFVYLELPDDDEDGNRDSWASFATAKSCPDSSSPLAHAVEVNESQST